ncbi:unnamed protein product [Peronospora belbahrii]|uniref:glucan endo-1,3-beta-D-glucosidase n=1 Tax=Peronospora belbahrii TaxID=622444 RepID=A0ABN8CL46_9STRA|nr:unnamed protein product [Peronospora belbahrii]
MVKVTMPTKFVLATCLYAAAASAESVNFINKCSHPIELYHSQMGSAAAKVCDIAVGDTYSTDVTGPAHMYRHTVSESATLLELSCDSTFWMDMSIIPPDSKLCKDYIDCKAGGTKTGFNVPMSVVPKSNIGVGSCSELYCAADDENACADAYHFPMDNTKTHSCPTGTKIDVTFCFTNNGGGLIGGLVKQTEVQDVTQTDLSYSSDYKDNSNEDGKVYDLEDLGSVLAKYEYKGKYAGNVPGVYDSVIDIQQCTKKQVSVNSPVGPMSEPVSLIFRGPCEIENIAVFSDEAGDNKWNRVSYYSREAQTTDNMVFMNNKKIDYSGKRKHSPQCYASADGKSMADMPTVFGGVLDDASDPSAIGGGPGISTGVEVNIMSGEKCKDKTYGYCGANDHQGWGGGKKAFVTRLSMPLGKGVNRPAFWILNAQIMHVGQYDPCNCRGMGPEGRCGELDAVEVIETNLLQDMVSTHFYFFDGSILSPGGDNFAKRSYESTVYVVLIDDSNDGLIKIVQLETFNFSRTDLGSLYHQLVAC